MESRTIICSTEGIDDAVRRACADKAFRNLLLEKPEAALAESGVVLQKGQGVVVVDFATDAPPPLLIHLPPFGADIFVADGYAESELVDAVSRTTDAGS